MPLTVAVSTVDGRDILTIIAAISVIAPTMRRHSLYTCGRVSFTHPRLHSGASGGKAAPQALPVPSGPQRERARGLAQWWLQGSGIRRRSIAVGQSRPSHRRRAARGACQSGYTARPRRRTVARL